MYAIATHCPRAGRWFHTAVRIISTEQPTSERMEGKILWSQIVPADWKYQTSRPTAPRLEGPTHLLLKISAMCSPLPKGGLHKGLHKLWGWVITLGGKLWLCVRFSSKNHKKHAVILEKKPPPLTRKVSIALRLFSGRPGRLWYYTHLKINPPLLRRLWAPPRWVHLPCSRQKQSTQEQFSLGYPLTHWAGPPSYSLIFWLLVSSNQQGRGTSFLESSTSTCKLWSDSKYLKLAAKTVLDWKMTKCQNRT